MGTIDAFQRLVWSPQFKQNCFPHRSKMGGVEELPQLKQILLMREAHPPISQGCRDSVRNSMPAMNFRKPSVPDKKKCKLLQSMGNGC